MSARYVNHSHWGPFEVEVADGEIRAVHPHPVDPDPSPLLGNIRDTVRHPARVAQPMVRAGWLDRGPGPDTRRGAEPFVPVSWEQATALLADELARVVDRHGNEAIYGGSYGWASAGRFHHAQSQVHRFLNCIGGFTRSVNTYSTGSSMVLLPHLVGDPAAYRGRTSWDVIAEHTELLVAFGGIPLKNTSVAPGGVSRHIVADRLAATVARGTELVLFSPIRDDLPASANATWHPLVPGTDAAVMLALANVLITEDRCDQAFLDRYTVGFDRFRRHVLGADGTPAKTPEWAEAISGIPADDLRALARRMAAGRRTLVTVTWSLQRARHGEQPVWLGLTLAAMLGQLGLPGGGFGHGYGSMADVGLSAVGLGAPRFAQGRNPVRTFIPVARVSDMLLHPGEEFDYDGQRLTYPDIRLVYWCGGNPFHHHQDLARLRRALHRPDTVVVHDPFWTPMARHADVVLPATTTLERNDIGATTRDPVLLAMQQAIPPVGQARNDYDIFTGLAERLGVAEAFTEGRDEAAWLRHMYETWRAELAERHGLDAPEFDEFWRRGHLELPVPARQEVFLADFRADPDAHPLRTPSGRIEIFSERIAGFGYADCPGHPTWLEPDEWLGGPAAQRHPLLLVANQPRTRLHSQLDPGAESLASKVQGREPIRIHPADAAARGIADGQVVRVFNDRGSCLAGAVLSDALRPGVVQLSTGAWYAPLDPADPGSMCVHGNPNVLTRDQGTSALTQGCAGQHTLVEIERFDGPLPPVTVHEAPPIEARAGA